MKVIFLGEKQGKWERITMEGRTKITNTDKAIKKARELYNEVFGEYPMIDECEVSTNLDDVLDYLGIIAQSIDFSEIFEKSKDVAGLILKEENEWYIYSNCKNPAYRQRFTIAHEIGHYYLNHVSKESSSDVMWRDKVSSDGTEPLEISANAFAAELLMPEFLIKGMYDRGYSVRQMAYELRVSIAAITHRMKNLGY